MRDVSCITPSSGKHSLEVWWRGDDDLDSFTIRFRTEEQLHRWETAFNKLIFSRMQGQPFPGITPSSSSSSTSLTLTSGQVSPPENSQSQRRHNQRRTTIYEAVDLPIPRIYGSGVQGYQGGSQPPEFIENQYPASLISSRMSHDISSASGSSSRPSTGRTTLSLDLKHDARLPLRSQTRSAHLSQPPSTNRKRDSGSTTSNSDYSDHTSPIIPNGHRETSLLRDSRSQRSDNTPDVSNPNVKIKVYFQEDIFVIQVPFTTEYSDLVEKVDRKLRLCGSRRNTGPPRMKYKDEDGDLILLGSTEDVQMAFSETLKQGGMATIYVT